MSDITVVINDDDDGTSRVNPATGTIETDQPDGGMVVNLNAYRKPVADNKFFANLAEELGGRLGPIADDLWRAVSADDKSRQQYLQIRRRGLELLGLELREPRATASDTAAPVEGMSTVTNPLLLEAVLKSWANAAAELLPAEGPTKAVAEGESSQQTEEQAEALEQGMNFYLTTTASEYYPDTSQMLLWGSVFGGSGFKKVYRCPMRRRPVSESIDPADFIVSNAKKDLRNCERITHQTEMRPTILKRMQALGVYRDTKLTPSIAQPNVVDQQVGQIQGVNPQIERPEDQPHIIWEIQCELDLPEYAPKNFADQGIPLPYLVTMDKESREILALRRDWNEDDEHCHRKRLYVRFPYVPGPGFYGTGLLHILGNSSMAMTAVWREALDAGMYANFPSAIISKLGGRQNTSDIRLAPGTLQPVETNGQPINTMVAPLPYKDVTTGLLTLMDKIQAQADRAGGIADMPVGEGIQNVPVGTMLAQIEQSTKVIAATFKGLHQSQQEELDALVELFRQHPEDFWRDNPVCGNYWNRENFEQALQNCDLKIASDPNVPSHVHRIAKAIGLVQLTQNPILAPHLNTVELLRRVFKAMREDEKGLLIENPPAPPQQGKQGADPLIGQARIISAQAQAKKASDEAQRNAAQLTLDQQKLAVQKTIADSQLARELIIHRADTAKELAAQAHDDRNQAIDRNLEVQKMQNEQGAAAAQQGLAAAQHRHEGGLAVAKHHQDMVQQAHERAMDVAEHRLNVHEAMKPEKPEGEE